MENRQHRSGNFPRQLSVEWTKRRGFPSPKLLQRQRANGFWGFECIMNMPECAKWSPAPPERGLCSGEVEYPTSFHMQSWVVAVWENCPPKANHQHGQPLRPDMLGAAIRAWAICIWNPGQDWLLARFMDIIFAPVWRRSPETPETKSKPEAEA